MENRELLLSHEDGVAVITLNKPERLNAWTGAMRADLGRMLAEVGSNDAVRAVVVTGAGERAFCSGQDFTESQNFEGGAEADRWLADIKSFYETIRDVEKPTIAALNGIAAGSGFQVAMLMDYRIGHAGVTMGQPELNNGIPSVVGPWGVFAPHLGVARSMDLILTGRMMNAKEARHTGLLNEIVPAGEVLSRSIAMARELGAKPPIALRLTKRAYREATQPGFDHAFEIAEEAQREAFASGEPQRCMEEFFRIRAARKSA
ncbi:enoyl-CoA hydratase/isomerase family protein [Falsochrobactrum sp. TDYN1]|uniref:Enoyl-CoA hydratase/isomerase family protein n=1 Tax=Falsochrobactrum tianjinense TaxID=2706015 RepID=A0A949PPP8_9HYPH|nr:enoyl-CoA hydratase/isomerase family protein [Falsochrobactrum sp. TDYN1]MBV2145102.1 enoyl-CoA hydratase/isomerase family protein [Falsochrobactrum sp. TDYN1]